jgi:hypothetical protein
LLQAEEKKLKELVKHGDISLSANEIAQSIKFASNKVTRDRSTKNVW